MCLNECLLEYNLGLHVGRKGPECNPDFTSEVGANDLM